MLTNVSDAGRSPSRPTIAGSRGPPTWLAGQETGIGPDL